MKKIDKINSIKKANLLLENRRLIKEGAIDGKFAIKQSIKNAIYKILQNEGIEGRYHDEYWAGISKLTSTLDKYGIDNDLVDSKYAHIPDLHTQLPNMKVYNFVLNVTDKSGVTQTIPLKVTCSFVGRTGTMEDNVYEVTYYMP